GNQKNVPEGVAMPVKVGVPRETSPGEKRVALAPSVVPRLAKLGVDILVEKGAGEGTRIPDSAYEGVTLVDDSRTLYRDCDIILKVQSPSQEQIRLMREGAILLTFLQTAREVNKVRLLR